MTRNRRRTSPTLCFALAMLLLFIWLAVAVSTGRMQDFDSTIRTRIHERASPAVTEVMQACSALGSLVFVIVSSLVLIVVFRKIGEPQSAAALAWTVGGAIILENILKYGFQRARPPDPFFESAPPTYSFPSGHALFSVCFYFCVARAMLLKIARRPARVLVYVAIVAIVGMIGLSRIYLGVHYPTDVLGGYLIGAAWLATLAYFHDLKRGQLESV